MANTDSSYAFYNFANIEKITFNNNYNTSNATNMAHMFGYSPKIAKLDLSSFNTSNVTNMEGMFGGWTHASDSDVLRWENQVNMGLTEIDLSSFDTHNVTDMNGMFGNCGKIVTLDLSNFDTGKVTDMNQMFNMPNDWSSELTFINFGEKFSTSNVRNMWILFGQCANLRCLHLETFDFSNVDYLGSDVVVGTFTGISEAFADCICLETIYVAPGTDLTGLHRGF